MKVKIKKVHESAVIPAYALPGDAGLDLVATAAEFDSHDNVVYYTGLQVQIPEGYVGLIFPRSSISKKPMHLRNSVGVIDSGYRGELILKFGYVQADLVYQPGDKVGQLIIIPYPKIEFEEVDELDSSERGEGGFGSTGGFEGATKL